MPQSGAMDFRFRRRARWEGWSDIALAAAVFVGLFGATSYVLSPPGPKLAAAEAPAPQTGKRFTDHHYRGCRDARANDHENIASWEPSYRAEMDGDGDGLACEPVPRSADGESGWLGN